MVQYLSSGLLHLHAPLLNFQARWVCQKHETSTELRTHFGSAMGSPPLCGPLHVPCLRHSSAMSHKTAFILSGGMGRRLWSIEESTVLYSDTCSALSFTAKMNTLIYDPACQAPDMSCYDTANRLCVPAFHIMWFSCSCRVFFSFWTESSAYTGTASKLVMGSP